jgi:hypothetical protein
MPEEHSDRPVKITSLPLNHPAIRKLARAYVALARLQQDGEDTASAESVRSATTHPMPPAKPAGETRDD